MITSEQLKAIYKEAPASLVEQYIPLINQCLDEFSVDTPLQRAMFLAQIGHESGQLRYVKELATGQAYEGRKGLGNTSPGDGVKYKGRGLIQITGKRNYVLCSLALDLPLLDNPSLLEEPVNAVRCAGWFWYNNNLNALCNKPDALVLVTKRINGGTNGLEDREKLYERAKRVLM